LSKASHGVPFGPAQVQNELPYLVEHIEYMRLLGVNRIVVCDDRSTDNTTALQARRHSPSFWARSQDHWSIQSTARSQRQKLSGDSVTDARWVCWLTR